MPLPITIEAIAMSSFNLEGMTASARVNTIREFFRRRNSNAFRECQLTAEPSEARHAPPKRLLRLEKVKIDEPASEGEPVPLSNYVSAMVGLSRDIRRHDGRLYSLSPRINDEALPRLDEFFSAITKLSRQVENSTCYYHIGDGIIARVRGSVTKMYISHGEDFHEYADPGFFVDNYYVPDGTTGGTDSLTLNILESEMMFHIEVETHEEAMALMFGRFDVKLRAVLVRSILFAEAVSQDIARGWNVSGAIIRANREAYSSMPTESVITAALMQHFGASVDDSARQEYDSFNFFRIAPPSEPEVLAHYDWLVSAKLHVPCLSTSSDSNSTEGGTVVVPNLDSREEVMRRASKVVFIKDQKLFRRGRRRSVAAAIVVLGLAGAGSYASFGQGVQAAEAVEKALSLLLFGVVLAVLTILSARRDEDLVTDILKRRVQLKTSRGLEEPYFQDLLDLLQTDANVHECLSTYRCGWVAGEKTGNVHLHRFIHMNELKWKELLIRDNGDIFFGDKGLAERETISRKARMEPNGFIRVEGRQERSFGYILRPGDTPAFLE